MMKTRMLIAVLALAVLIPGVALHVTAQAPGDILLGGDIELTLEMEEWLETVRTVGGIHIADFDGVRLVVVADGERPTAGYGLEATGATEGEHGLTITVKRIAPSPGDMVAEVITYPHAMVAITGGGDVPIRVVDAESEAEWVPGGGQTADQGEHMMFAVFNGRADFSSVELFVPQEGTEVAFRLAPALAEEFDGYGLEEGDTITFTFTSNEWDQRVITEIIGR